MSFGFSVGDLIAVSTLARNVWGRFRDSSNQFNAIQTEVAGLCLTLDDIANSLSGLQTTDKQANDLSTLIAGCRGILDDTERYIRKNESLGTDSAGLGSKTRKAWKKLKWDPATVNELRDRMVANATYLNAFNASLASQASRATSDKINVIADDIQGLKLDQSQKEREGVLQWISSLNFTPQQSAFSSRRQEGTGSWFLESQLFQEWLKQAGKTLLCQGIPGAGKTMLASLVIDHLQQITGEEKVMIAYVFCDYKKQDEQTPVNLTASIAMQMLQHQASLPESVLDIYKHHYKNGTRPNINRNLEMVASSMTHWSRVYLIVDALDELGNGQVRQTLTGVLRRLQDSHQFNLMITSRYIPSLASDFHQTCCVDVQASSDDIRRYVDGRFVDLPSCVRKNPGLQETIAAAIVKTVKGMFLLAQLHMDSLRDKTSTKLIKKALETLPTGLKALDLAYDGATRRIEDQLEGFRLQAIHLLGWLTYSKRLMTIKELQYALAVEPGTTDFDEDNTIDIDEVVGFCAGLVIVDKETGNVRLVHYTAQEYLRRNGDIILASAKQEIAISCLTYLSYDEFEDGWVTTVVVDEDGDDDEDEEFVGKSFKDRVQKYPFLVYAARHWADHVKLCSHRNVEELMLRFAKDDRKISSASQVIFAQDQETSPNWKISPEWTPSPHWRPSSHWRAVVGTNARTPLTAMHMLAYMGCPELIIKLSGYGFDTDVEDSTQRTPLWWAASQGHQAVVELLLSQSHVNVNNCGLWHSSEAVQLFYTPLGMATLSDNYKIVKSLVEREDVDVNLSGDCTDSPLHTAALHGYKNIVDLLLTRKDININSIKSGGKTPLGYATMHGQEDIVKELLKIDNIQVNLRDDRGLSPLNHASGYGYERVTKALLSRADIEVNSRDVDERSPLLNAARKELRSGGEANALHLAVENGSASIVRLLLSCPDIDMNARDRAGKTVLLNAARSGQMGMVKLLVGEVGIDVNLADELGRTPLLTAAEGGNVESMRLLLDCVDVNVNIRDRFHKTALHSVVRKASGLLVRLLTSHDKIDVNISDASGSTALHEAATHGRAWIIELLLGCVQLDVNAMDNHGRTPLLLAARGGKVESVRMLLTSVRVDVNAKDNEGMTPLAHAMMAGYADIVELICAHGSVDLNPTDYRGRDIFALVTEQLGTIAEYDEETRAWIVPEREKCLEILCTAMETRTLVN